MNSDLVETETQRELSVNPVNGPDALIALGLEKGADLAQMKELYEFKRQWEADEAKKAYTVAVANFKTDPPKVYKDKKNSQYNDSLYTSIEGLVNSVIPALSKHGLSHRWDIQQSTEGVTVTCILTHVLGHSESAQMVAPPDKSGAKNPIQQIKSTITYLKGSTFEAITGLASEVFNKSDDGNGAGTLDYITEDQAADLEALITEVGADKTAFLKICKIDSIGYLSPQKLHGAIQRLEQKRKDNADS